MKITKEKYKISLKKVMDYCLEHPGCGSFEIITETKIEPEIVLKTLTQLNKDGIIRISR